MLHFDRLGARLGLSSCPLTLAVSGAIFETGPRAGVLAGIGFAWFLLELWIGLARPFRGDVPAARWVSISRGLWLLGPWLCGLDRSFEITCFALSPELRAAVYLALAAALLLRARAVRALGAHFSYDISAAAGAALHTSGAYRWIRHPAYLGLTALCVLPGVALESAGGTLWLAATTVPQVLHRIAHEERALLVHFGAAYRAYQERTSRLIPGLF
jgi:protein-S-isoprenylcysteine O-methyltransferase Ste14